MRTLVIVKEEDFRPPLHQPLEGILKTHEGEDGLIRVVDVGTASGVLKRKLAPLFAKNPNYKPLITKRNSHEKKEFDFKDVN